MAELMVSALRFKLTGFYCLVAGVCFYVTEWSWSLPEKGK